MKRSQEFSPPSPDTLRALPLPVHKKPKTASVSHGISVGNEAVDKIEAEGEGSWTTVEKRKTKKARKLESQHNVCSCTNQRIIWNNEMSDRT